MCISIHTCVCVSWVRLGGQRESANIHTRLLQVRGWSGAFRRCQRDRAILCAQQVFPAHASMEALRIYQALISDDVALLDCLGLNFIPIFSNRP